MSAFEETTAPVTDAPAAPGSGVDGMARLLELATKNADELVAEARAEAAEITAKAQAEADKIVGEARIEAERVRSETEEAKSASTGEIARLRQTEQEHRDRMKSHLQEMLAKVEANSIG